jgi:uncharacterized protein YidB (DUF937 family)
MGLLDNLLGGLTGARGGNAGPTSGMSKASLLLLALLAYRTYQGKGQLADMLGRSRNPAPSPADGGYLPGQNPNVPGRGYAPSPNAGSMGAPQGGGLGDLIRGGLLRGGMPGGSGAGGGLGGLLGGLLAGGAAGGLLSGGLSDLLRQFQQNGQGHVADSWVGRGPNQTISPDELERGLGEDNVRTLAEQAGMPCEELLSSLSQDLPDFVDQLTPEGRLPSEDETGQWL